MKPWSAQIELTFGCNNKCPMCYKQVLYKKDYEFMKIKTAETIAKKFKKAKWDGIRIEFAMRGEPLLNPHLFQIIKIFRKHLLNSQICLTTNGNTLNPKKAIKFFKHGGNILLVDCYDGNITQRKEIYKKFKTYDYYNDDFNPYHRHNPRKTQVIVLLDDIKTRNTESRTRILLNMGGNIDYKIAAKYGIKKLKNPLEKKCVRPFREIIIMHDGTIPICCEDAAKEYTLGNIHKIQDLNQFWNKNKKLTLARTLLYNKKRIMKPCSNCDYPGGMRQGLLQKMPQLTKEKIKKTQEIIKEIQI